MSRLDITDYEISMKTGFLLEKPLTRLPSYFDPWNDIALRFAELVVNKTIREEVLKLPVLDHKKLTGQKEIRLGHLELVMMTSGYLYMNGPDASNVPTVLPKCLAIPLYGLYEDHGIPPVVTYADIQLNNGILKDPNGPTVAENIEAIISMPAKPEEWECFFSVSYMVEYVFGQAMPAFQDVLDGIDEMDEEKIAISLNRLAEAVHEMQKMAGNYHGTLTTEEFFPKMVAFFVGYGETTLFDGLVFEGVKDEPVKMKNSNAGQTPIFKVLDALLGIEHEKGRQAYTDTVIEYLLPSHRKFIKDLRNRPKQLKSVVEESQHTGLKEAYNNIVQSIVKWRSYHVQLVTKYILQGMKKNLPPETQEALKPLKEFTMGYIKGMRDDCKNAV